MNTEHCTRCKMPRYWAKQWGRIMIAANFRTLAVDETEYWAGLPPGCSRVFGLYLFCEGEATHVCSLTPSSWCVFLENVFVGLESDDPFVEEFAYDNGGESGTYRAMIDPATAGRSVSEPFEFETFETADPEESRADLWEQAEEYLRGTQHEPGIIWDAAAAAV